MTLNLDVNGLEKLRSVLVHAPENLRNRFDEAIGSVAGLIRGLSDSLIHSKTGGLVASAYTLHQGLISYTVGYAASYAKFVHDPTQPHLIVPRRAGGVLAFEVGGATIFARHVHHPGTVGNPFLKKSFDYYAETLNVTIVDNVKNWLKWSESG